MSSSDLPDFAKAYQLACDREYKSFVYLTIEHNGKSYHFKNGEIKIDDKTYSLSKDRRYDSELKYGYIVVGDKKVEITHSGLTYNKLSEGAQYKVNRSIGRAMAYIESKKLTSQISHFAERTNSTNPPYDEMFDEYIYRQSDENYRISSFKSYVKSQFDEESGIDFGHNSLNLYGLSKLIEYKNEILSDVKSSKLFKYNVFEQSNNYNERLAIMSQNSHVLKNIIDSVASGIDFDTDKIGKLSTISDTTAKGFLKQLELVMGDPDVVTRIGKQELGHEKETKLSFEPNYKPLPQEYRNDDFDDSTENDEPPIYVDENEYTVYQDSNGDWRRNDGSKYFGKVYSSDGCPIYDPKDEYRFVKQTSFYTKKSKESDDNVLELTKK